MKITMVLIIKYIQRTEIFPFQLILDHTPAITTLLFLRHHHYVATEFCELYTHTFLRLKFCVNIIEF